MEDVVPGKNRQGIDKYEGRHRTLKTLWTYKCMRQ